MFLANLILKPAFSFRAPPSAQAVHTWRKSVVPGLVFISKWDPARPLVIYAMRIDAHCPTIKLTCDLADHQVYANDSTLGRATVTTIVKQNNALGGVNGDFFPFTGQPLNLLVRNGEILSLPFQPAAYPDARRSIFAWGPQGVKIGYASTQFSVSIGGNSVSVGGFNQEAVPDGITVDNVAAGLAYASSKQPNVYAVLSVDRDKFKPDDSISGTVQSVSTGLAKIPIKKGTVYVVGTGSATATVKQLRVGQRVTFSIKTTGFDWTQYSNAVGGAPLLLKGDETSINADKERISPAFSTDLHPRTAIGYDRNGNTWLVAVDGRTTWSKGVSLNELADIMKSFGCTDAMNLDGGGSTTFNMMGITINHPSDGVERAVAEGVLVSGTQPKPLTGHLAVEGPSKVTVGKDAAYRVFEGRKSVYNGTILWRATGAAWMDQAGVLHPIRTGATEVTAIVNGQAVRFKVTVSASSSKN